MGFVPTGIRRVVRERNATIRTWGFVPIPVEQPRDGMCLKTGGGSHRPKGDGVPTGLHRSFRVDFVGKAA